MLDSFRCIWVVDFVFLLGLLILLEFVMKLLYLAKGQSLFLILGSADVAQLLSKVNDVLILTFAISWTVETRMDIFFNDGFETDVGFDEGGPFFEVAARCIAHALLCALSAQSA